jgi:hypothetical protein
MGTNEVALAKMAGGLAQPTEGERAEQRRIQGEIDAAMRGVIGDVMAGKGYRPSYEPAAGTVTIAGAPKVTEGPSSNRGFYEPRPLGPPPGIAHVDRIANALEPNPADLLGSCIAKVEPLVAGLRRQRDDALAAGLAVKELEEMLAKGEGVLRQLRAGKPDGEKELAEEGK